MLGTFSITWAQLMNAGLGFRGFSVFGSTKGFFPTKEGHTCEEEEEKQLHV
jgi:hypothetical protein